MATLANHPGFWLRDDAAAAFNRMEAERGKVTVNSAGRTVAQQQVLINRYAAGGKLNRPPYLFRPASPAGASNHVKNGGVAVDVREYERLNDYAHLYGFRQSFPGSDPVHFDYVGVVSTPAGGVALPFNQDVKNRQAYLNTLGYNLVVDGLFGAKTKAAIADWQKKNGLVPDGIWGPKSAAKHAQLTAPAAPAPAPAPASNLSNGGRPPISRGSKGPLVGHFQRIVKERYPAYAGKLKVDNDFGPATEKVARTFQAKAGLTVDGVIGRNSWNYLGQ